MKNGGSLIQLDSSGERRGSFGSVFDGSVPGAYPRNPVVSARHLFAFALGTAMSWFVGCAEEVGVDDSPGGAGGGDASSDGSGGSGNKDGGVAGNDGGWPTGSFGSPCSNTSDCGSGFCGDIGQGTPNKVCITLCPTSGACPAGGYCTFHADHGYVCVPDVGNQCNKCTVDAECPNIGDRCTPSPNIDRFCARDCSWDSTCPSGFDCVAVGSYPPGMPVSDGGVPDAAAGEAGSPTKPLKMCVPKNGESCPCNSERNGVKRRCTKTNGSVTCEGTEACNGASQKWEGCTAGTPQAEVCDGADNDCNGTPDDDTDAKLCAGQGTPPNATWKCSFGACVIGACTTGWAAYPPGPGKNGCACKLDTTEPANDTCSATAPSAGSVTDANTTPLTLSGTLSSDADVDWWRFNTVDSDEGTTNSYHIKILFTAPATNSEFLFDVIRGGACGTPDSKHSGLTSYDWCVDGTGPAGSKMGEKACGPTAAIHCGPHTKAYAVRVRRKPGATGTCSQYTLTVTAKGGGVCDFTQACDPQVNEAP